MWDESMKLSTPEPQRKAADWNRLRCVDFLRIAKAKSQFAKLLDVSSLSASKQCLAREKDAREVEKLRNLIRDEVVDGDVLRILTKHLGFAETNPLQSEFGLCGDCVLRVHNQLLRARQSVWKVMVKVANEY